jgi:hypothetical protein
MVQSLIRDPMAKPPQVKATPDHACPVTPTIPPLVQPTMSPKSCKGKELSNYEKGMIVAFFYCLGTISMVASLLCRPQSTVKSFLICATEWLSTDNLPQPGGLPLMNWQMWQCLIWVAESNHTLTRTQLQNCYALGILLKTMNLVWHEANLKN